MVRDLALPAVDGIQLPPLLALAWLLVVMAKCLTPPQPLLVVLLQLQAGISLLQEALATALVIKHNFIHSL